MKKRETLIDLDKELENVQKLILNYSNGIEDIEHQFNQVIKTLWNESLDVSKGYIGERFSIIEVKNFKKYIKPVEDSKYAGHVLQMMINVMNEKHTWDLEKVLGKFKKVLRENIKNYKKIKFIDNDKQLDKLLEIYPVVDSGLSSARSFSSNLRNASFSCENYNEDWVSVTAQAVFAHAVYCQSKNLQLEIKEELEGMFKSEEELDKILSNKDQIKNYKIKSWLDTGKKRLSMR